MKVGKRIEIALCDVCSGKGYVMGINPDNPKDEGIKEDCRRCNGSGRLRWTITVEEEPYK